MDEGGGGGREPGGGTSVGSLARDLVAVKKGDRGGRGKDKVLEKMLERCLDSVVVDPKMEDELLVG